MTSTSLLVGGVVVLLGLLAWWLLRRHRAHKQLRSVRAAWGQIRPVLPLDDGWTNEAWRTLRRNPHISPCALDERTWTDLDLDRVVATLDRSHTGLGRQRLYQRLRDGVAWRDTPWLEQIAALASTDSSFRDALALILSRVGRTLGPGLWSLTVPGTIVVRTWYWCFPLLTVGMVASIAALVFDPRAILAVAAFAFVNMTMRAVAGWQVPGLLEPLRQLTPLLATARQLDAVADMPPDARLGMRAHITALRSLERMGKWVSRDPHDSGELGASLWEYVNVLLLLDANALLVAGRVLDHTARRLRALAEWVGDVDCALGVASLRAEPRVWCRATKPAALQTTIAQAWHPLVEAPVPNDAELCTGRGLVLTGANMTGKSTYLRTVSIAIVLANALDTCPAASYEGRMWRVRSLIGRSDDLSSGTSYYFAEAKRIVEFLNDVEPQTPTMFVLDELLRGTNTMERLAAGEAVLRGLLAVQAAPAAQASHGEQMANNTVLVATHDGELVSRLADVYNAWHFRESVTDGALTFDFLRRSGPSTSRTAIALLALSGAPAAVVERARALVGARDGDGH